MQICAKFIVVVLFFVFVIFCNSVKLGSTQVVLTTIILCIFKSLKFQRQTTMIMQNSGTGCLKPFLIPMNDCFNKWIFCCWLGRCNCLSRPQQTQEYVIGVLYLFPLSTSIYLHKNYISFIKLKLCFRQRIENKRHAPFNQRCLFSHFCILLYEP